MCKLQNVILDFLKSKECHSTKQSFANATAGFYQASIHSLVPFLIDINN